MKTSNKKKIDKVIGLISKEIQETQKSESGYNVTLAFNDFDNIIRFDREHLENTSIEDIEKQVVETKLINMISTTENKIISFNKYGANYQIK